MSEAQLSPSRLELSDKLDLHATARKLNAASWRAFPLNGKNRPLVTQYAGPHPYTDVELLRMRWSEASAIGVAERHGVLSLDVDHKNGRSQGRQHLEILEETYGALPPTHTLQSPTGGVHLRYKLPRGTEGKAFRSHVRLPDGSNAHIDIIHARHRFHRVHNPTEWLEASEDLPELPVSWMPAVFHSSPTTEQARDRVMTDLQVDTRATGTPKSFDDLICEVAAAPQGTRNQKLNDNYFIACCRSHTDEGTRERFFDAARQAGLSISEINGTLDSARQGAWVKWQRAERWLDAVEHQVAASKAKTPWVLLAAEELVRLFMDLPQGTWIHMSVRRMAECLVTSPDTAAKAITLLQKWGFLKSKPGRALGLAKSYTLNETHLNPDTYPPPLEGQVSGNELFGLAHRPGYVDRTVRSHVAFSRVGPGAVLTPTCADVLLALRSGSMVRSELVRRLNRSPGAVSTAVRVLESAGLVDDQKRKGVSLSVEGSLVHALDEWAAAMGVDNRKEWLFYRHDQQRLSFARQHRLIPVSDDTPEARDCDS